MCLLSASGVKFWFQLAKACAISMNSSSCSILSCKIPMISSSDLPAISLSTSLLISSRSIFINLSSLYSFMLFTHGFFVFHQRFKYFYIKCVRIIPEVQSFNYIVVGQISHNQMQISITNSDL